MTRSMRSIIIGLCLLLSLPASAQKKPADGVTARLFAAISKKDVAAVRSLLAGGAKANVLDKDGISALDYAAQGGSIEICTMLLDKGAQPNKQANEESAPLLFAIEGGSEKILELLIDHGAAVEMTNEDGLTPLMMVAKGGALKMLQVLIKRGADVNRKDKSGKTALLYAAGPNKAKVVALLKAAGAKEFEPTLIEAVRQDDTRVVRALLAKGVDANEVDAEGRTALFYAAEHSRLFDETLIKSLLQKGANPNARDRSGKSVLQFAKENKNRIAIDALVEAGAESPDIDLVDGIGERSIERARAALKAGADPNTTDEHGGTVLTRAVGLGEIEIARLLLDAGAKVDAPDTDTGYTALMEAVAGGRLDIVKLLLDRGASAKMAAKDGYTALLFASNQHADEVIKLLVERGADVRAKNTAGLTVLMSAASECSPAVLTMLLDKGAKADINAGDQYGQTALMRAASAGNAGNVRLLLQRGADPNRRETSDGQTALALAAAGPRGREAQKSDYVGTIKLLLQHGARINAADARGDTALDAAANYEIETILSKAGGRSRPPKPSNGLMLAVTQHSPFLVRGALKKKGADPNRADETGYTPLVMACMNCSSADDIEVIKLLLQAGAKPDYRDKKASAPTALYEAAEAGSVEAVKLLIRKGADPNGWWQSESPLMVAASKGKLAVCRALLDAGARADAQKEAGGRTALGEAAHFGGTEQMLKLIGGQAPLSVKDPVNVQIVKLLIAKGAKVNARLVGGYTALIQAAEIGNTGVAQALVDAGANVKLATETGLTALIAAASAGDITLVQLLLAKGADINAKDERNRTPLSAAEDGGHEDVADLLRRSGARQ